MKEKTKKKLNNFVFTFSIAFLIFFTPYLLQHYYYVTPQEIEVNSFYTNTNFVVDLTIFKKIYQDNFNTSGEKRHYLLNSSVFIEPIDPPTNLFENKTFNCEDASNTLYNLASKYGIKCILYHERRDYLDENIKIVYRRHVGIRCLFNGTYIQLI